MSPLIYLSDLCRKVDKTYNVSLEYGAQGGDIPRWQMRVALPLKAIFLLRNLVRGDDVGANLEAARSLGNDLKRIASWAFREEVDAETFSLDTHKLA